VLEEGKTVGAAARDLDLTESSLRNWVEQARADRTKGKTGLTTAEREELARLRKENRILLGDMPTIVLSRNLNAFASSRPHTPRSRESRATHDISSSSTPANITCSPRIASSRSTCLPPSEIHS
jgi:transposase-like protein